MSSLDYLDANDLYHLSNRSQQLQMSSTDVSTEDPGRSQQLQMSSTDVSTEDPGDTKVEQTVSTKETENINQAIEAWTSIACFNEAQLTPIGTRNAIMKHGLQCVKIKKQLESKFNVKLSRKQRDTIKTKLKQKNNSSSHATTHAELEDLQTSTIKRITGTKHTLGQQDYDLRLERKQEVDEERDYVILKTTKEVEKINQLLSSELRETKTNCETKTNVTNIGGIVSSPAPFGETKSNDAILQRHLRSIGCDSWAANELAKDFQKDEDMKSALKLAGDGETKTMNYSPTNFDYVAASPKQVDLYHRYQDLSSGKSGRFDIFLSYRRSQKGLAGRLKGSLESLGFKVFMDICTSAKEFIGSQPFQKKLMKAVSQCKVMLVLITPGPSCSDINDPRYKLSSLETMLENKRNGKKDWVYEEIVAALKQGIKCIPVLSGDEGKNWRTQQLGLLSDPLLSGISSLLEQNCQDLHEEGHYENSIKQLYAAIKPLIPVSPYSSPRSSHSSYEESLRSTSSCSSNCGCEGYTNYLHVAGCKYRFNDFLTPEQIAEHKANKIKHPTTEEDKEATTCIVLGDPTVGKSVLVNYMFNGKFIDTRRSMTRYPMRKDRTNPGFVDQEWHLWDAPGQKSCEEFNNGLLPDGHFFVIMYACNDRKSFENVQHHLDRIYRFNKQQESSTGTIYLVSNKIDLPEEDHTVSHEEGLDLARRLRINFAQVSAKYGKNVPALWTGLGVRRYQWLKNAMRQARRSCIGSEKTKKKCPCVIM